MSRTAFILLLAFCSCILQAQSPSQLAPQSQDEDGGSRQVLESIFVPNLPGAPFTLTLHTEWVRGTLESGTFIVSNERRIARDSAGRIYQERWLLVPNNGSVKSRMTAIQISDPTNQAAYTCMIDGQRVCGLRDYSPGTAQVSKPEPPFAGPLPDHSGFMNREALGNQLIAGVDTVGVRESIIYNPGVLGNDDKITVTKEYWFSSQLGFNLLSKRSDPRSGRQTFAVTNLDLSEPDSHLFEPPDGFAIVDHRAKALPGSN